jgi:hypothetical protein
MPKRKNLDEVSARGPYSFYCHCGRPGTESNNVERGFRGSHKGKRIRHYKTSVVRLRRFAKRDAGKRARREAKKRIQKEISE